MGKMDYQVFRASWVSLEREAPKENGVIRESQETEAHKVNKENQAFKGSREPLALWGPQETRAPQDPLGTRALQASPASLAPRLMWFHLKK